MDLLLRIMTFALKEHMQTVAILGRPPEGWIWLQMGGYQGIRDAETIGVMPFTVRPAHGLKRLWLPRLECTGMLALRPAKGFQMHCIPRSQLAESQALAAS